MMQFLIKIISKQKYSTILLIFTLFIVSCSFNESTPSPTLTSEVTLSPTATPSYIDIRESLSQGSYIVYWEQSTWYISEINGSNQFQFIPNVTSEINTNIQLSPDGNLVAFSSDLGQLSIYDFRTGKLKQYSNPGINDIFDIRWMPDNKTLLYLGTFEEISIPDAYVGIYSISVEEEKSFVVLDLRDTQYEYGLKGLSLSRDGRWLAFYAPTLSEVMSPDAKYAIYIMDLVCLQNLETCSESIKLIGDGRNPNWMSDSQLSWICPNETQNSICVTNVNKPEDTQVILNVSNLVNSQDANFVRFSWSPNGKYIAIILEKNSDNPIWDLYVFPLDGGQVIKIDTLLEKITPFIAWSPDSKYLSYANFEEYIEPYGEIGVRFPKTDLYVYDIEKSENISVTSNSNSREVFGFFISIK